MRAIQPDSLYQIDVSFCMFPNFNESEILGFFFNENMYALKHMTFYMIRMLTSCATNILNVNDS